MADLAQAQLSAEAGHHEWACFASHQAAEKALKALHLHHGQQSWGRGLGRSFRDPPCRGNAVGGPSGRSGGSLAGAFGSYGRGTAAVGSDLDLLLVDASAEGPQHLRLRLWPLERLPLSCDALVLTPAELDDLLTGPSRMGAELKRDLRWVVP